MLRLSIETQPARLGLSIRMPQMEIAQNVHAMKMTSTPQKIEITAEFPTIEIDTKAQWAELGYNGPLGVARELAALGRQGAFEAVGRWAREGDELAAIERGSDIASLAAEAAWPGDNRQINVDVAPKSRIKVRVHGRLEIQTIPGRLEIEMPQKTVSLALRPGVVKSYLLQRAAIDISVVGDQYSVIG